VSGASRDRYPGATPARGAGRVPGLHDAPAGGTVALPAMHPAFVPFAPRWTPRAASRFPDLDRLNLWARAAALALPDGRPLSFVAAPAARPSAQDYERRIAERGEILTRPDNLHDACNALVWLAFPRTKAALTAIHVAAPRAGSGNRRDRSRDAATLLDESGMLVACADTSLVGLWTAHRWREAFRDRRDDVVASMRAVAIGHGLLAKLVAPFPAITAKVLVLPLAPAALPEGTAALVAALDAAAAAEVGARGAALAPADLLPLPVAALPGWDCEGRGAELFDDAAVFRPRMLR
jgi:Protein of unknown function (DUF3025)